MRNLLLLLLLPLSTLGQLNTEQSLLLLSPQDAAFRRSLSTDPNLSMAFFVLQSIQEAQLLGENISSRNFGGEEIPNGVINHINNVLQYTAYTRPGSPGHQLLDSVSWADVTKAPFTGKPVVYGMGSNTTTGLQTLQNINALTAPLLANSTYEVEALLRVQTTGTAGTGYGVTYSQPTGSTITMGVFGPPTSTVSNNLISSFGVSNQPWLTGATGQSGVIWIKGSIITGPTAGNLIIQHLKVTSGTSTVFSGSYLKILKIQ